MDTTRLEYHGEFTIEERKAMTAYALRELRKGKKLSQKEVAAKLNIPATTYNTYESGRSEPPIEILVRLSHLYNASIDVIVMRDRMYHSTDDAERHAVELRKKLEEVDQMIPADHPEAELWQAMRIAMGRMADAMDNLCRTPGVQQAMDDSLKK